jgi:hypothetical protein
MAGEISTLGKAPDRSTNLHAIHLVDNGKISLAISVLSNPDEVELRDSPT